MTAAGLRAVLFDLDDTLLPQGPWLAGAFAAVAVEVAHQAGGHPDAGTVGSALLAEAARGSARGGIIDRALDGLGLELPVAPLVEVFAGYRPNQLDLYPGALEALGRIRERVPVGLVSDGRTDVQGAKLAAAGLMEAFDVVVLSDDLGRAHRKPDPLPYRTALEALAVDPAEAAFVGDRPETDMVGADALGMVTVRVSTGEYSDRPDLVTPSARVADVVAAVAWLGPRLRVRTP